MQRVSTTVVALVGGDGDVSQRFAGMSNVAVYRADSSTQGVQAQGIEAQGIGEVVAAWDAARRTHTPYFVHDLDPLARVADAWAGRVEGNSPVGELEVAVSETLARWRTGALGLPDYYVLWSPDRWPAARRHWYLGVLGGARPLRVVVSDKAADPAATLVNLPSGPWWPELDVLLADIERVVPDRTGTPGDQTQHQ